MCGLVLSARRPGSSCRASQARLLPRGAATSAPEGKRRPVERALRPDTERLGSCSSSSRATFCKSANLSHLGFLISKMGRINKIVPVSQGSDAH